MNVEVKKVDDVTRELKIKVSRDRVNTKLEDVYKEINKNAKIKGFRPGKVPRHILEKHHGGLARQEMIQKLIPEAYQEGIHREQLHPIDYPDIRDVDFKDGELSFTAKLDIKPEVKITDKDYKGIKVKRKSSKVTDEDINKTLEYFKQGQGKDVTLDDAFAKGLGYPSLEEFKATLSRQIEMDKDRHNKMDVENQIVEALLKKAKFTTPQSLVARQLEQRVQQALEHERKHHHASEEDLIKKEAELRESMTEQVAKDVRAYLVFDKIGQLENIQVGEKESVPAKVMEFLLKEANWEGSS